MTADKIQIDNAAFRQVAQEIIDSSYRQGKMDRYSNDDATYEDTADEIAWAERAEYWVTTQSREVPKKFKPADLRPSLILVGHGMHFRINHGALEVRNGFTHYPQTREEYRFFPRDPALPSRIIILDGSGAITLDVLRWLSEQDIPLIQLDFRGHVVMAIGAGGVGADPKLAQLQLAATTKMKRSLELATFFVREKLIRSRDVLTQAIPESAARDTALGQLNSDIDRLRTPWSGTKVALLGIEGKCAQVYFDAWRDVPIDWKGTAKKPIPDAWRKVGSRRSRLNDGTRGANHPLQAMLNYAYAVLESQIRIEVARVGLDPSIGFLHEMRTDRAALILDLLEPVRPLVDRAVLEFVGVNSLHPADFTLDQNGICRLHPQMARRLVSDFERVAKVGPVLAELIKRLGHVPPAAVQHRSKAWLAQKKLRVE